MMFSVTLLKCEKCSIKADALIIPLIIIFYCTGQLTSYIASYIFITVHEAAHAASAMLFNTKIDCINLLPIGLNIETNIDIRKTFRSLIIFSAGPIINIILAFIFFLSGELNYAVVNAVLAIFNLLPIIPLDGHNIMLTLICRKGSLEEAYIKVHRISIVFTVLLIIYSCLIFIIGKGNILNIIIFLYLLGCQKKRKVMLNIMNVKNVFYRKNRLLKKGYYEGRILTVIENREINTFLKISNYDCFHYIFVVDEELKVKGMLTEQQIIDAIVNTKHKMTYRELLKVSSSNKYNII